MKRLAIAAVGLALVVGTLAPFGSSVRAQPVASIVLPPPGSTVQLYSGCNNIALTFPNGTASENVMQAVTPAGAVQAIWRYNAALSDFQAFSPAAPDASDLVSVNLLDAVWLCVTGAPLPTPTPPPAAPTATPVPSPAGGRAPGEVRTITTPMDDQACYQLGQADAAQDRAAGVTLAEKCQMGVKGCVNVGPNGYASCGYAYARGYIGKPFE